MGGLPMRGAFNPRSPVAAGGDTQNGTIREPDLHQRGQGCLRSFRTGVWSPLRDIGGPKMDLDQIRANSQRVCDIQPRKPSPPCLTCDLVAVYLRGEIASNREQQRGIYWGFLEAQSDLKCRGCLGNDRESILTRQPNPMNSFSIVSIFRIFPADPACLP